MTPQLLTTFGNPNHLAAFQTLAACAALGVALSSEDRQRMLLWLAAYLAIGVSGVLSFSRGGIAFLAFSQVVLGGLLLMQRGANERRQVNLPPARN